MKRVFQLSTLALAFALSACGGETDETPDITEAIPLDPVQGTEASGEDAASGEAMVAESGAGTQDGSNGEPSDRERPLPGTMETGSNPPDMTAPPAGSKVQRVD